MSGTKESLASRRAALGRQASQLSTAADDEEDEECEVVYRVKSPAQSIPPNHRLPPAAEEILAHFDEFGSTPPRTRTRNKYRDWDQKQKLDLNAIMKPPGGNSGGGQTAATNGSGCPISSVKRMLRQRVNRRNTMDCALLNEMFVDDDCGSSGGPTGVKFADKRSKQLLRESERDMKRASMAIIGPSASVVVEATNSQLLGDEQTAAGIAGIAAGAIAGHQVVGNTQSMAMPMLIKCSNPYKSVSTRPVGCRTSAPASAFPVLGINSQFAAALHAATDELTAGAGEDDGLTCRYDRSRLQVRRDFHETFANLIKLGSDKQDNRASNEIDTWQTELKDLIWLELQAWHAERTPEEQDRFLCAARKDVPKLLDRILHYRFRPHYLRETSADSGISSASESKDSNNVELNTGDTLELASLIVGSHAVTVDQCKNCISLYCKNCQQQQCAALREVEELLTRLEAAEALYPSSQVMGNCHPIYRCESFVGRVKAMCLWYNITKYQRLKLTLVGTLFKRLHGQNFQWPVAELACELVKNSSKPCFPSTPVTPGASSTNEDSGVDSVDSRKLSKPNIPRVKFSMDGDANGGSDQADSASPEESGSSSADSETEPTNPLDKHISNSSFAQFISDVQQFRLDPISRKAAEAQTDGHSTGGASAYRRYIEHVMKSRGLGKSLSFLHRLHNVIIRKVQITLERQDSSDSGEFDADIFEEESMDANITPIDPEQEEELRRYGVWSPEAQSLELPSYAPTFVFLSVIPLEIMHEYLRMRIESRPVKPNPLSLEQLLKEVREGLILAMTHRERFNKHIHTALEESDDALGKYMTILQEYDVTVSEVLAIYLDYVERWVLESTPENQQKAAIVREWSFAKLLAPMIHGQHSVAAMKFCHIVGRMLQNIGQRLSEGIATLNDKMTQVPVNDYDQDKAKILLICREMQSLFTSERENAMRVLHFAKILCRDLEQRNFHRDHELCDGEQDDAAAGRPVSAASTNTNSPPGVAAAAGAGAVSSTLICPEVQAAACILQREVLQVRHTLTKIVEQVLSECADVKLDDLEDADRLVVQTRTREILHQCFKFGFDYHKELVRLFEMKIVACTEPTCVFNLSLGIIEFSKMWMSFVTSLCERGRGVRPRWACQGLEFLIAACDPTNTKHLNELEFEELKAKMDACISHVVGMVPEPEKIRKRISPRSRKVSPNTSAPSTPGSRPTTPTRPGISPRIIGEEQRALFHQLSVKEESLSGGVSAPNSPIFVRKQTSCVDGVDAARTNVAANSLKVPARGSVGPHVMALRQIRIRDSVNQLDLQLEQNLRSRHLIGQVKTLNATDKVQIRARSVHFRWHRGIKIGQGRFGKVYTAVNNSTGELMAMKEIPIQPNETRAIKNVAEELKIFEGISHRYLVKYYGIEVHREELLIFMELCAEGTLESLVELSGKLHEALTRRFTAQLLTAVEQLHKHGVVHRDIKTANIFLTNGGNCLKLGDFGSAVKIQAHTTVPGELKGYVGTQAYMAPEVFTKTNSDGHGRAADIWSAGCVTIEMASGKRPWAQFDSNFQIMFKVGMGETPDVPADLSAEGHEFLEHCLEHDAKRRWTASELLQHNFCKVDVDADSSKPATGAASKSLAPDRTRVRKTSLHRK